ncbi:hypothetical protein ACFQV2_25055 [Actinokineospora soli]|uniref:MYXO-CTERM domain-containing protein n=1 Tax=Actinokineospora soli TaxID=1048753 RepID=A0ABW2TSD7_9PSEU
MGTIAGMVGRAAGVITRWLLVCALAFAVAVMHHLASGSHGADGHGAAVAAGHAVVASAVEHCCPTGADHLPSPPSDVHDLAHLCLAVLLGLLVLVTALVAWRSRRTPGGPAPPRPFVRSPGPPPPLLRGGRATLHSVCVLRL